MFTLSLSDPLWRKLDDAHRDRDIPDLLRSLSEQWDPTTASSLFWDCLCHQDTCYGATYASIPHLLRVAASPPAPQAISHIAHFLGHVAMVAFWPVSCCESDDDATPQGLPLVLEAWERKLDTYRSLAEFARKDLANPDYPEGIRAAFRASLHPQVAGAVDAFDELASQISGAGPRRRATCESRQADLDRYLEILSRPPVNAQDLETISRIREAFFEALPKIASLCERAYQAADDPDYQRFFLAGVAAALGARGLSQLFKHGDEGGFACARCGWTYDYIAYDDRIACYADPAPPGASFSRSYDEDPKYLDYQEGAPHRADGFVRASESLDGCDPATARIRALASARHDAENLARLKLFTGDYVCGKCGATTTLSSGM